MSQGDPEDDSCLWVALFLGFQKPRLVGVVGIYMVLFNDCTTKNINDAYESAFQH